MRRRRCHGLAAILLLFLACATACERHTREASPPARPKDRLTTALLSDPKTFNPKVTSRCVVSDNGIPRPKALDEAELAALKKAGVAIT